MPNQIIIFIALLAWFDSLSCYDISADQPNRLRRYVRPVPLQNVTKSLARAKYHSYTSDDGHVIYHTNDLLESTINEDKGRSMRKMNLLGNLFQKRQPLYLVNGTVCRFVNAIPICTTLSTSGVLPPNAPSGGGNAPRPAAAPSTSGNNPMGQNISFNAQSSMTTPGSFNPNGNFNPNNQNFNNPNQNFNNPNQNNQNFNNPNANNNFAPRPAALVEDDSEDINVNAMSGGQLIASNDQNQLYQLNQGQLQQNLQVQQLAQQNVANLSNTNSNLQALSQLQSTAAPAAQTEVRPYGYLVQRRPQFHTRKNQFRPS